MLTQREVNNVDWSPYEGFSNYIGNEVFSTLLAVRNRIVLLLTGNQFGKCVTYQTLIDTPNGVISIGQLFENKEPFDVYAWDGKKKVIAKASAPFKKEGLHKCYRITMSDGRWVEVADHHQILLSNGAYVSAESLYLSFSSHLQSTLDNGLSAHGEGGLSFSGTTQGYRGGYSENFHLCDAQPPPYQGNGQVSPPLQDDVQKHSFYSKQRMGVLGKKHTNNLYLKISQTILQRLFLVQFYVFLVQVFDTILGLYLLVFPKSFPLHVGVVPCSQLNPSTVLHINESVTLAYIPPMTFNGLEIDNIKLIGCQEVYDMTVGKYHNYFAGGLIHHNTLALTRMGIYRYMGLSKIASHNIKPTDLLRTCRWASEMLPTDSDNEVRHTVYPAIKAQLPSSMLLKDITIRNPVMSVQPLLGGKPGHFEFVSYGQSAQSKAGQQRRFIGADEVPPYEFHEESMPRLAASDGQIFYGMTPVEAGWTYEEIYERARTYYRTKTVRDYLLKSMGQKFPAIEHTDSLKDICVIQAASDDSPIYKVMLEKRKQEKKEGIIDISDFPYETVSEYLDSIYMYDDPDVVAMRRYGVFRQITGAVHKEFNASIHVIPEKKHFADGVPRQWKRARMIDYHQAVPWAITFITISPDNEVFVYNEFNPDPRSSTTLGITRHIVEMGRDDKFQIDLIDPLAGQKQTNTNTSVIEDMNRIFREMKREGLGTGANWQPWDTKGTKGQDKVRERLINSKICGRPFNNLQKIDGKEHQIPTLWILDNCRQTAQSLKSWKMEEWIDRDALITKDQKDKPQGKWSHFNMCLEAIFKDARFSPNVHNWLSERRDAPKQYFQSTRG